MKIRKGKSTAPNRRRYWMFLLGMLMFGIGITQGYGQHAQPQDSIYILLPESFTPNNDGVNDVFEPTEIRGVKSMKTTIFNRWGEIIFYTESKSIDWEGMDDKGMITNTGMYPYTIEIIGYDDDEKILNGKILVMR